MYTVVMILYRRTTILGSLAANSGRRSMLKNPETSLEKSFSTIFSLYHGLFGKSTSPNGRTRTRPRPVELFPKGSIEHQNLIIKLSLLEKSCQVNQKNLFEKKNPGRRQELFNQGGVLLGIMHGPENITEILITRRFVNEIGIFRKIIDRTQGD